MRIVAQRVSSASVRIGGEIKGRIDRGFCILLGVGPNDTEQDARAIAEKIAHLRVFDDGAGKMNLSLHDVAGEALVVSQFTLYADCQKGRRPSFTGAASPESANGLYEYFVARLREAGIPVQTGLFGAEMTVQIENDGPVTILLDSDEMKR